MKFIDQLKISVTTTHLVLLEGETALFTATASGINRENFTYQWTKEGGNGLPDKVSDADETTLTIPNVTESDEGQYYCTVTNEWGRSVDSNNGTLAISGMLLQYTIVC